MLQIKDVRKKYVTGELVQTALDGVSLNLRESELVAILGPSGSGKSTLLNVIGGLDQYDSGDLIINGISTKKYTDRDWDSYRNHTIGFVFQSYNLIPHQTVLANVELALTISGVPKSQRRKRAVEALEKVGLGSQLHKKPNQMSGGQMQRVAIARALVNNPSILLADEPTGALDSETSIQVMELLKEVSKDRLVVMVTHNPELAEQYADRIVRVKDGKIIDDTNPFSVDEKALSPAEHKNMGKSSMSFLSALALSFNNLRSKKGRTLMTAFAGSIGIIGIALILALSVGFQKYIDDVQEDTLAGNPLTLQSETADIMSVMMPQTDASGEEPASAGQTVTEQPALSSMFQHFGSNDLASFKTYLEAHYGEIGPGLNSVQYWYRVTPRIFVNSSRDPQQVNPSNLFKNLTGNDFVSAVLDVDAFQQMPDDASLLDSQYQVLQGRWPEKPKELVFVLPAANQLSDHIAYTLGLKQLDSLDKMIQLLMDGQEVPETATPMQWTYDDLMGLSFRLVSAPDLYKFNEEYQVWEDMGEDREYMQKVISGSEMLNVVGIVCPREGSSATALTPGIGYLPSLTEHIVQKAAASPIVQQQLKNPDVNVFTGKAFDDPSSQQKLDFQDLITIDGQAMSDAFGLDISESVILRLMEEYLQKMAASAQVDTTAAQQSFLSALTDFIRQMMRDFVTAHADEDGNARLALSDVGPMADSFFESEAAQSRIAQLADAYDLSAQAFTGIYKPMCVGLITEYIAQQVSLVPQENPTEGLKKAAGLTADPAASQAAETHPQESAAITLTSDTVPETTAAAATTIPSVTETTPPREDLEITPEELMITIRQESADQLADSLADNPIVQAAAPIIGKKMMERVILDHLMQQAAGFSDVLANYFNNSFYVDGEKLAGSVHLSMDEQEMKRLMDALSPENRQATAQTNLRLLGYADLESPDSISFYLSDFQSKENLVNFIADYNRSAEQSGHEEKMITYTDMTAMMMDSVRTMIRTVSYSLIAFVAVSLVVSSIMIGIITYISVMERTKEIGILRAMGASRHNVSQVFNAETFIIGLFAGLIGIVISLILLIPGNRLMHQMLGTTAVNATLPLISALILITISMLLTLLGGLIPSHQAAKKDPVIALRTE